MGVSDETFYDYLPGTVEGLEAERDTLRVQLADREHELIAARAWSARWKTAATIARRQEILLLVGVCRSQETINELLTERDEARLALAAETLLLARVADWIIESGGWRAFYYGENYPEGVFDLSDRFNPDIAERLRAVLPTTTPPAPTTEKRPTS